ncbi:hypothetical protein T484DRAFT_1838441, partial [Baffinella frigidus]
VEHNLKKGRNASGRCGLCGGLFTLSQKAVQCQTDKFWYHTWANKTVRSKDDTCYEKHKPDLKVRLRMEALREIEKDEEEMRRANWDRDHEQDKLAQANRIRLVKADWWGQIDWDRDHAQDKLAQANRIRLKRAVMANSVGKLAPLAPKLLKP